MEIHEGEAIIFCDVMDAQARSSAKRASHHRGKRYLLVVGRPLALLTGCRLDFAFHRIDAPLAMIIEECSC